jgi:DedD protein
MGLFSFLNKNKQETTAEDSGYYSRPDDDDAVAARARSKRASSAGEPAAKRGRNKADASDPVLPEKKRARRRLVGAVALALAVAVGLPMLLDAEPKPLASDITIQIPSKEKAAPLPVPADTVPPPAMVGAAAALDQHEEIIDPPKPAPAAPVVTAAPAVAEVKTPAARPEPAHHEVKAVAKAEPKPEPKPVEAKPAAKPAQSPEDAARALAILEGKAADKAHAADPSGQKVVLQVAALASQEKVNELQSKLRDAGIKSFTQKVPTQSGERIRIRVGPFSKEEAEKMRARLGKIGLSGTMVAA